MSYPLRAAVVLLSLSSLAACTKVQARTPVATPALSVPVPEARLVIPAPEVEAPVEAPPPPEPPPTTPPPPRQPSTPVNRPSQPVTPVPQPVAPPAAAADPPPQVLLPNANVGELEKRARDLIINAERDLARVQPNDLSRESRTQYTTAKQMVEGSKKAIDIKNYVLAVDLAGKAATLAGLLVKG